MTSVALGTKVVGTGQPVYLVAEIGLNHNGDLAIARRLIDAAVQAGCDAVKFQKRTPALCIPAEMRGVRRETPWGLMTYMEYRHRIELGQAEYEEIDRYCRDQNIPWFASCWDAPSVEFIEQFDPICYKVASASLTDLELLTKIRATGRPVILSTGMSTMEEIRGAVALLDREQLIVCHCNSSYPCRPEDLNLRMVETLARELGCPVGYSGHEVGLQTTLAAVVLGASLIERHITLDRAMWGSDQAASVEPGGWMRLARDIRVIETALGDGVKRVSESERAVRSRLRRSG